ncbi:MAG TPA: arylamine N-acetyltransferase [Terriglobales bacterium]|nr:arylamine N-acetyltransferase [Terriglobales bacterium]
MSVNVPAYLERIGYSGPVEPTLETLRGIHRAHMLAVPFENLDIWRKRKIVLDPERFVHKVVEEKRGGFCYELNGAFAALLQGLGFRVTLLSARVARDDGSYGQEFDHLTLRVDLDEPWLADVGFGDSFLEPLQLKVGLDQKQGVRRFTIIKSDGALLLARKYGWFRKPEYSFTLTARKLEEFAGMCHYHQTSRNSPFTQKRLCTRATPEGRITLTDNRLIVTRGSIRDEYPVTTPEQWYELLREHFGVVLYQAAELARRAGSRAGDGAVAFKTITASS